MKFLISKGSSKLAKYPPLKGSVHTGFADKIPMGFFNKDLTMRGGQMQGQRHVPFLFEFIRKGRIDPGFMLTHPMPPGQRQQGLRTIQRTERRLHLGRTDAVSWRLITSPLHGHHVWSRRADGCPPCPLALRGRRCCHAGLDRHRWRVDCTIQEVRKQLKRRVCSWRSSGYSCLVY